MSDLNEIRTSSRRAGRLHFFLLWQGQFVSSAGDAVYELALGFFLLRQYHSGAVMALVLALSAVPGILTAPFAGVVIDRADGGRGSSVFGSKKTILAAADLTRGACVIALGAAALLGHAPLRLLLLAGAAVSAGGAFFTPCLRASLPLLIEKSRLTRANSLLNLAYRVTETAGSTAGGVLYALLGAPLLFLFDGVSFLFSGALSLLLKMEPTPTQKESARPSFGAELRAGLALHTAKRRPAGSDPDGLLSQLLRFRRLRAA